MTFCRAAPQTALGAGTGADAAARSRYQHPSGK